MHGDFSRDSFDPAKHFSRVLLQQGRALLDADSNEQVAIFWHYLRTLAADLIGPHGGPADDAQCGFEIDITQSQNQLTDLTISAGRYYVDGLLCENTAATTYYYRRGRDGRAATGQPHAFYDPQRNQLPQGFPLLVYLVVWERLVTAVEDPEIREVALGANGPDTAARAEVVWQVRATRRLPNNDGDIPEGIDPNQLDELWSGWVAEWQPPDPQRGLLRARAVTPATEERDVCAIPPESRYRGAENQLYRVEIHTGGPAGTATFKWSRDNGAQIFPIEDIDGRQVRVTSLGRDLVSSLQPGDWVELVDDEYALRGQPAPLLQIESIDPLDRLVTLAEPPDTATGRDPDRHPFLRRWNHRAGDPRRGGLRLGPDNAAIIVENDADGNQLWLTLEDGVQIAFTPVDAMRGYRSGDYWLIPARTATGDLLWPGPPDAPAARPPHGVQLHFAPLALVRGLGANEVLDVRRRFAPLATLPAR